VNLPEESLATDEKETKFNIGRLDFPSSLGSARGIISLAAAGNQAYGDRHLSCFAMLYDTIKRRSVQIHTSSEQVYAYWILYTLHSN